MSEFESKISSPEAWFHQAWEMFEASKVNFEMFAAQKSQATDSERQRKLGLMKGSMLLLGLAIENALKGALVHKTPPELKNGRLSARKFFHKEAHNLIEVTAKLDLELSTREEDVLERLSTHIQWASRYKTPLDECAYISSIGNLQSCESYFQFGQEFIEKLQNISGFCPKNGWS